MIWVGCHGAGGVLGRILPWCCGVHIAVRGKAPEASAAGGEPHGRGAWAVGAHGVVPAVVLSLWVLPVMQHVAVPPEAAGWGAVVVVAVVWLPCCGVQVPDGVVVPAGP